jgi:two-component sensor histidine kinase
LNGLLAEGKDSGNLLTKIDQWTHRVVLRCARALPYAGQGFWAGQLIALVSVAAAAGVRGAVDPLIRGHIPVLTFFPFVLVASIWGGTWSGLSAILLSALIADVFWVARDGRGVTLIAFVLVCLFGLVLARLLCAMVELHAEQEQRAKILAHEVKHRANNLLAVVQGVSAQTARTAKSVKEYQAALDGRVSALAAAQHLLTSEGAAVNGLQNLLAHIVAPFGRERFLLDGPLVPVPDELGTSFALLLHELSTNAMKYGALSAPDGQVIIRWERDGEDLRLTWREQGGPSVTAPARTGFGTRLLKSLFASSQGQAALEFYPDGVQCQVRLKFAQGRRPAEASLRDRGPP